MPAITEMVHPRGLSFAMQRKVVVLRDARKMTWPQITAEVRNLKGEQASMSTVKRCYHAFAVRSGRVRTKYANCRNTREISIAVPIIGTAWPTKGKAQKAPIEGRASLFIAACQS